jgi:hypothetical protein
MKIEIQADTSGCLLTDKFLGELQIPEEADIKLDGNHLKLSNQTGELIVINSRIPSGVTECGTFRIV